MGELAIVVSVKGAVWVVGVNGQVRAARVGEPLLRGETVMTGPNGQVELGGAGGQTLEVPASQTVRLDAQLVEGLRPQAIDAALGAGALATIEQIIARGGTLDDIEATAAGAGGGGGADGGHTFVRLLRIVETLDPLSFAFGTERPDIPLDRLFGDDLGALGGVSPEPVNGFPELEVVAGTVYEAALPGGSDPSGEPVTAVGVFTINSPDGVGSLVINGTHVTNGGTVAGQHGVLTVTLVNGVYQWTYTLDAAAAHPDGGDANSLPDTFSVVLTDGNGDSVAAVLPITIVDDLPAARDDGPKTVTEDDTLSVSGNVLDNDSYGADGASPSQAFAWGDNAAVVAAMSAYGQLTLSPDGSYRFELDNASVAVQQLTAADRLTFELVYTIRDGDGDPATATLVLNIQGADDSASVTVSPSGVDVTVYEAGLTSAADPSETASNSFQIAASDGIATLSVGGLRLTLAQLQHLADLPLADRTVDTGMGLLVITGYTSADGDKTGTVTYTYTLKEAQAHTGGVNLTDSIEVHVGGLGGSAGHGSLKVDIVDDGPRANDDADHVTASSAGGFLGRTTTGNVINGDGTTSSATGQDGAGADGGLLLVASGSTAVNNPTVIVGAYGELTLSPSGFYTYRVTNPAATDGVQDVFSYTVRDADGSTATAQLTIFIGRDNLVPEVTGSAATVSEKGLDVPGKLGSEAGTDAEIASGSFTVRDNGQGFELLVGGKPVYLSGGLPATITGALGTLVLTGYTKTGSGASTEYTIDYTYTLTTNTANNTAAASDVFSVKVVDGTGDASNVGAITITIEDDAPVARADVDSVAADYNQRATGNVITGDGTEGGLGGPGADSRGADGAVLVSYGNTHNSSSVSLVVGSTANGATLQGRWGTLVMNPNGTYTYTVTANHNKAAIGQQEVFTYTLRDADGSTSTSTLTINITDTILRPVITATEHTVYEAALDKTGFGASEHSGTNPTSTGEFATGTFTINTNGENAFALRTINGVNLGTAAGQVFNTAHGGLTITGVVQSPTGFYTYTYRYELTQAADHSGGAVTDTFTIRVRDYSGDTAEQTLRVHIVDDAPVARDDGDTTLGYAGLLAVGNVLTGQGTTQGVASRDAQGADSPGRVTEANGQQVSASGATVIQGIYGKLTLFANGGYSYQLDQTVTTAVHGNDPVPEVFVYTLTDADGSTTTARLTIDITPLATGPGTGVGIFFNPIEVDEAGLNGSGAQSPGTNPGASSETVTSNFIIAGVSGIPSLTIQGQAVDLANLGGGVTVTTPYGNMTISGYNPATGVVSYTYTLTSAANHSGGSVSDAVTIAVSSPQGTASATLPVHILDDAPFARNDTDSVKESDINHPATGNLLTGADVAGGDANTTDGVADVGGADAGLVLTHINGAAIVAGGSTTVVGSYGTLTVASNGAYSYVPRVGDVGGNQDVFTYTVADADGSTSTATLTLNLLQDTTPPIVTANDKTLVFYEKDLPQGSDPAGTSETQTGLTVSINTQGVPLTRVYNPFTGTWTSIDALSGATPATPVTVSNASWTVTYTGYAVSGNTVTLTYDVTLKVNLSNTNNGVASASGYWQATNANGVSTGNTASGLQSRQYHDDAPIAVNDTVHATEGAGLVTTGNLFDNDVRGADGQGANLVLVGAGTGPAAGNAATGVGIVLNGAYGTLVVQANGSYVYTMTAPSVPDGATDVFHYTVRDSDGSRSTASITVDIAQDTRVPIVTADTPDPVYESGLSQDDVMSGDNVGSNPGGAAVVTSGSFSINGQGETFTLQIDGQPVPLTAASVGSTLTGDYGVLTITGIATVAGVTTVSYTYALGDNRLGAGGETFTLTVTDVTGDTAVQTLHIDIVDDAPVARNDTDEGLNVLGTQIGGNVVTGEGTTSGLAGADSLGADHAAVVGVAPGVGVPGVSTGGVYTAVGAHGTLTLNANGSYSYVVTDTNAPADAADTFTYLLQDQDGSTASATLTITLQAPSLLSLMALAPEEVALTVLVDALEPEAVAGTQPQHPVEALRLADLLGDSGAHDLGAHFQTDAPGVTLAGPDTQTASARSASSGELSQGVSVAAMEVVAVASSDAAGLIHKLTAGGTLADA